MNLYSRAKSNLGFIRHPITRSRHYWRTRAKAVFARYLEYTALEQPLETVKAPRPRPQYLPNRSDPISLLWVDLAAKRENAPKLLDDLECRDLKAAIAKAQNSIDNRETETYSNKLDSITLLSAKRALDYCEVRLKINNHQNRKLADAKNTRTKIVISVSALQDYNALPECGSRTHAETIIRIISENIKNRKQIVFLIDSKLPELNNRLRNYADQFCTRSDLPPSGEVCMLVNPLPAAETLPMEYYLDEGVRKVTVWLDGIAGAYPNWFMDSPNTFFSWQSNYEMIATNQWILNLSQASKIELSALIGTSARVITIGTENSSPKEVNNPVQRLPQVPFPRYAVAIGNAYVHKNLAAAAAAFPRNTNPEVGLVVWGRITRQQELGIEAICAHLRVPPNRICYLNNLSQNEVWSLLSNAELMIVPSFNEGFSLPVVEAITHDTPVVASNIPAHQELIGPGWWLQPPDDPAKLGRAINRALKDPQSLLEKQKKRLSQSWHPEQVDEKISEFLNEILN